MRPAALLLVTITLAATGEDPRSAGAHVNRANLHEFGTRRTDDVKNRLQARAALED